MDQSAVVLARGGDAEHQRAAVTVEASDEDLLSRVARGDRKAFADLVRRHRRRLVALAARIVGPGEAEDIVQDTFTRAWTAAPSWKPTGAERPSYAAWLSRVAVNLAIDRTRRSARLAPDEVPDVADLSLDAEAAMIRDERIRRLEAAVAGLPTRQRVALSLTYDAELSNAEAASAMETSVGAFELLLVRARRALRSAMSGEAME